MIEITQFSGRQIAAARALLDIGQVTLAKLANISAPTLRRIESTRDLTARGAMTNNVLAVVRALEEAGVIFIDQNGNGPGVRLKDRS